METKVVTRIKCETDKVRLGYWHPEREEWIDLEIGDDLGEASEVLGCSEDLLNALVQTIDLLVLKISDDLRSVWGRLDRMESSS